MKIQNTYFESKFWHDGTTKLTGKKWKIFRSWFEDRYYDKFTVVANGECLVELFGALYYTQERRKERNIDRL